MWELPSLLIKTIDNNLPSITASSILLLLLALLVLRSLIQKILAVYFQINDHPRHHKVQSLEYAYFYHLSLVVLVLVEVEWNMFDLAIWVGSYVGVGIIRKAIYIIRI